MACSSNLTAGSPAFDAERAYADAAYQVSLGPRTPDSVAHDQVIEYIVTNLEQDGWVVELQVAREQGQVVKNVVARRGRGKPWIILGAHYDSRLWADQDAVAENQRRPVLGANDGASGVAVLLELARAIPTDLDKEVWLVFFDAEDNGKIPGWDWVLGSRAFVGQLDTQPDAVVVVDMVGDADLQLYYERSSDRALTEQIWAQAALLGHPQFVAEEKYNILDDHTPFLQLGIPAIDIIDFDYPYWHTVEDTLDKISTESLNAVGETLLAWLLSD